MKFRQYKIIALITAFLFATCGSTLVLAKDYQLMKTTPYEQPDTSGGSGGAGCGGGYIGIFKSAWPGATKSRSNNAFIDYFYDIAKETEKKFGVPWEMVLAQGIGESGAGTSNQAKKKNNFFGICAFDSSPNSAVAFPTPDDGFLGYGYWMNNSYANRAAVGTQTSNKDYLERVLCHNKQAPMYASGCASGSYQTLITSTLKDVCKRKPTGCEKI